MQMRNFLVLGLIAACGFAPEAAAKTPLMAAAAKADLPGMQKLIKSGADINAITERDQPWMGQCALSYAINSNSLEAVQILLDAGADVNTAVTSPFITANKNSNVRNLSILSHAINVKAPIAIIKALIKKGAKVDGSPKIMSDVSALMVAAFVGYKAAVLVLLEAGADALAVNARDKKTALDYATEQKHTEICEILKAQSPNRLARMKAHILKFFSRSENKTYDMKNQT